jgi:hypothetical protein
MGHTGLEGGEIYGLLVVAKTYIAADDAGLGNLAEGELKYNKDREDHKDRNQQNAWQQP